MNSTLIAGSTVIIINDGQYRWYADRETFIATALDHGWSRRQSIWYEPGTPDQEDGGPYARLCNAVERLDQDRIDETGGSYFHVRPDMGNGIWQMS